MKINPLLFKIVPLILVLILLPLGSIGCGTDFETLALELLEEWADAHDVNPTTPGGAVNLAKRAASDSTGDEEADAAIGLVKILSDIKEGDELMEDGEKLRAEGKTDEAAKKMDAAIEKRPNDWSYRVSRAALFYQNPGLYPGSLGYAHMQRAWGAAGYRGKWNEEWGYYEYSIAPGYNKTDAIRFHTSTIDELESSDIDAANMIGQPGAYYYAELAEQYRQRAKLSGSEHDKEMAAHYQGMAGDFRTLRAR